MKRANIFMLLAVLTVLVSCTLILHFNYTSGSSPKDTKIYSQKIIIEPKESPVVLVEQDNKEMESVEADERGGNTMLDETNIKSEAGEEEIPQEVNEVEEVEQISGSEPAADQESEDFGVLPEKMFLFPEDSQQVITVTNDDINSSKATLTIYEKVDGAWRKAAPDMKAFIGRNGFKRTKNSPLSQEDRKTYKYEGDGCSPMGVFSIDRLFGWGDNPGFSMPYMAITGDDYWVSGSSKETYNVHIHREGGPDKSWSIYEKLRIPTYKYAAIINYNMGPECIVGNGSAIFLHIADDRGHTSGCTAIPEADLLTVLRWLNPEKNPVIIQGTLQYLAQ